jgi:hypothetical protein
MKKEKDRERERKKKESKISHTNIDNYFFSEILST